MAGALPADTETALEAGAFGVAAAAAQAFDISVTVVMGETPRALKGSEKKVTKCGTSNEMKIVDEPYAHVVQ